MVGVPKGVPKQCDLRLAFRVSCFPSNAICDWRFSFRASNNCIFCFDLVLVGGVRCARERDHGHLLNLRAGGADEGFPIDPIVEGHRQGRQGLIRGLRCARRLTARGVLSTLTRRHSTTGPFEPTLRHKKCGGHERYSPCPSVHILSVKDTAAPAAAPPRAARRVSQAAKQLQL